MTWRASMSVRPYTEGDPDLYGLFYNSTAPKYPSGTTTGRD